jgi:putative methionine-R-sulfoxide reductase with GAF domain
LTKNDIVSDEKKTTTFDEQTLAKVLEAAYVLQEHRRKREHRERNQSESAPAPNSPAAAPVRPVAAVRTPPTNGSPKTATKQEFSLVLRQIVETQQQIQSENLDLESALSLIAERAVQVAQAAGAGIGILEEGKVRYRAAVGTTALAVGGEVPMEKALCSACLRVGQVIRCSDVNLEFLVDAEECARRGIESLIAAPIHHAGSVAGALELYYGEPQSFTEPDVHACQLMAGLAGEVLARREGLASKKSLQAERAAMRDALEKLKPNLEALVEKPAAEVPAVRPPGPAAMRAGTQASRCSKCGSELVGEEQFCGKCGAPRTLDASSEAPSMQSKVALLWQMQEQKNKNAIRNATDGPPHSNASAGAFEAFTPEDLSETAMPDLGERLASAGPVKHAPEETRPGADNQFTAATHFLEGNLARERTAHETAVESVPPVPESAIVKSIGRANWTSAAAAREFLERIARENRNHAVIRFLKLRRGDVYLFLAIILVACVIRWGVWSDKPAANPSAPATVSHRSPYADLSLFDRMLIKLGLADPPDPPVYKGNPNTKVWVDEQTALYYCPGSDLYGKTPKGRMSTQRDAQLDQFEPAYRRACD